MPQLSKMLSTAFNASTPDDDNTVIAAEAGTRIVVYGLQIGASVASDLGGSVFTSGAAGRELARIGMVSGSIVVLPVGRWPWFFCDRGDALVVNNTIDTLHTAEGNILFRRED